MVKIASFNVENLFMRPKAFNLNTLSQGQEILAAYHEVNDLFNLPVYDDEDKRRMKALLLKLGVYYRNVHGKLRRSTAISPKWAWMRKNRGDFDRQPEDVHEDVIIDATGRSSWIGWVELAKEPVNEIATRMTAKVIKDINADIIGIVEAEDRPSLVRFNSELMQKRYGHVMLVDGNDERGIDVGLMTRANVDILSVTSHVDDKDNIGIIFSRDCADYLVKTSAGNQLHVLLNHFKSQSGDGSDKRERQAKRLRKIVDDLVAANQHVVVMGDFNEGPRSTTEPPESLKVLFAKNGPLKSCYDLQGFSIGERQGTYGSGTLRNRLDYVFISKGLESKFAGGSLYRKGLWGTGDNPPQWEIYPEIKEEAHSASDHAAVVIDLNF